MASSLMQQLVRLMSDVVDFQVQQKTCSKLPSDLQKFLEWLTAPSDQTLKPDMYSGNGMIPNTRYDRYEKSTDEDSAFVIPEDRLDDRTQCLGSIQAVQELMRQYDCMDDEDKSKMAGVKEYLTNQLDFLNKKLTSIEEFNVYKYYKKRETPNRIYWDAKTIRDRQDKKGRIQRKINKFIKNFSKKHTSTAGTYDGLTESKDEPSKTKR